MLIVHFTVLDSPYQKVKEKGQIMNFDEMLLVALLKSLVFKIKLLNKVGIISIFFFFFLRPHCGMWMFLGPLTHCTGPGIEPTPLQ